MKAISMRISIVSEIISVFIIGGVFLFQTSPGYCETSVLLQEGIRQYQLDNYEEAVEILTQAREAEPRSSSAAFMLGLAYKQIMDYPKALAHLREAVTLEPRIREALVELIDMLNRFSGDAYIEEAEKWIAEAESAEILPARIAFLKGMVLQKKGKHIEAVEAFDNAASLNAAFTQSAEIQIAICYMKARELAKAKERLQASLLQDPQSDMAEYARRYLDLVERRMDIERPLHLTLGVAEQYNTNLISEPKKSEYTTGKTFTGTAAGTTYVTP
jgi:tetratricopeptide (TPR) repeat protein